MDYTSLALMGAAAVVMYFFIFRPQQKRAKELKQFRQGLAKGSQVVSTGGIHGKVVEVKGNGTVLLESNGTKFIIDQQALSAAFDPLEKK